MKPKLLFRVSSVFTSARRREKDHVHVSAWVNLRGVFALNLSSVLGPAALGTFYPAVNAMTRAWRFMRH